MRKATSTAMLATMVLSAGCTQTAGTPAPTIAGPPDPNSVTVLTLSLQPDSVTGCILGDASMTRPMRLMVQNDSAMLLTSGGIHYSLDRVRPEVYAGGYYVKIVADLSSRPKRLSVTNFDASCKWAATAA